MKDYSVTLTMQVRAEDEDEAIDKAFDKLITMTERFDQTADIEVSEKE